MIDFERARASMVESQLRTDRVTDRRILSAFATLPRERFVPEEKRQLAYSDSSLEVWPSIDGDALNVGFARASSNLDSINLLPAVGANVYDIMRHDTLVLTRAAVETLEARFNG